MIEKFKERIKELRTDRSLTVTQLGKELNLHYTTIVNWERGVKFPSLETLISVADFFGVTTDYLLGRTDY